MFVRCRQSPVRVDNRPPIDAAAELISLICDSLLFRRVFFLCAAVEFTFRLSVEQPDQKQTKNNVRYRYFRCVNLFARVDLAGGVVVVVLCAHIFVTSY